MRCKTIKVNLIVKYFFKQFVEIIIFAAAICELCVHVIAPDCVRNDSGAGATSGFEFWPVGFELPERNQGGGI